jgi:cytochrome c oxidase assembly protein subunit 11
MSRNRGAKLGTAVVLLGVIGGMIGLTAAAVPLYNWFCRVTGYGGTTQVAERSPVEVLDRTIEVRFNADVDPDLPWAFAPEQRSVEVRIGENRLAFFRAENRAERPIVGRAVFNVTPFKAGPYFSKIACFCFEEQILGPGEAVDMPVSFYVDPAIMDDPDARDVEAITLSYTFFLREDATEALADADGADRPSS